MKRIKRDGWTFKDVFGLVDRDNKGWIGSADLEHFLSAHKRAERTLVDDINLVITVFNKSDSHVITLQDFMSEIKSKY